MFSCFASGVVVCVSECLPEEEGCCDGGWVGGVSNFISSTFKENLDGEKIWKKTSHSAECAKKKIPHNSKAFGLAGLFVRVNEMRGQPCHNPNAQRGNTFPKADLHNSIRNGPKGSVTKIILSDCLQALYIKLETHSSSMTQRRTKGTTSLLCFCAPQERHHSHWIT